MPASAIQRLTYRDKFKSLYGEEFQSWFEHLARAIHGPGDFQAIRRTSGDGGLDGFVINKQLIYQVYAPTRDKAIRDSDTAAKIRDDFATAHNTLGGQLKAWTFLHNHPEAKIGKLTAAAINRLKSNNPNVQITILDIDSLWEKIKILPDAQLLELFHATSDCAGPNPAPRETHTQQAAERRWQYIQDHPIRGIEVFLALKGEVGLDWFRKLLDDTKLTFSRNEASFKLGGFLTTSQQPNTEEGAYPPVRPSCSFWETKEAGTKYWFRKIDPVAREFKLVAGFGAVAPWSMVGIQSVGKLKDIAILNAVGVSIPTRAYQVGIEEFRIGFQGDTFSFSISLMGQGLDAAHEMARIQSKVSGERESMPVGTCLNGIQLLAIFEKQLFPGHADSGPKPCHGFSGLSGPNGRGISFYPAMPTDFLKSSEARDYFFTVDVPPKIDAPKHIKRIQKKLLSNPASAQSYVELSALYSIEGRLQDAMECLRIAIAKAPPNADVHGLMADNLAKMGRFDEAFAHLEKAASLAPHNADFQTRLGVCLHELSNDLAALSHFQTAVGLDSSCASLHANLGLAQIRLRQFSEAFSSYKRAFELDPQDYRSAIHLGIILTIENKLTEAIEFFETAARLAPTIAEAHEILGQHLAKSGEHERAVESLQRAIDIKASGQRFDLLGASIANLNRMAEAERAFRCGVELEPTNSGILANLGATIANLGRFSEATTVLEKALTVNPNNIAAQRNLDLLRKQRID